MVAQLLKPLFYNITYKANCPNYGYKVTDATRNKLSDAGKGRVVTEATRLKISKAHKGKPKAYKPWNAGIESRMKGIAVKQDIITFRNNRTNEVFIGRQNDFQTKYNLKQASVSGLISGFRKSLHDWSIN